MPLRAPATHPIPISAAPPSQSGGIELGLIQQERDGFWCWAACVEMILKHFEVLPPERQCQIAQKALSLQGLSISCCTSQNTSNGDTQCDITLGNDEITKLWESVNIHVKPKIRPLTFNTTKLVNELQELLTNKRPIELKYDSAPTGHVVILYGWEKDSEGQLNFLFQDPEKDTDMAVDARTIDRPGLGVLSFSWTIFDPS